jgi:hypothetical protein
VAPLAPFATADREEPTTLTEVHILPDQRAEFRHPHTGVQHHHHGGVISRGAEALDGPEQPMLLTAIQPAGATPGFSDGRGDVEPVVPAEQPDIHSPVEKTLEGRKFAVDRIRFEVLGDQPAFVGAEVGRRERTGRKRLRSRPVNRIAKPSRSPR